MSSSPAARREGCEGRRENVKCIPILDSPCCATENKIQIKFYNTIDLKRLDDTSIPMIGKNMFLTTQVICTILEFLFFYLGEVCIFTVQWLSTLCFLTVSLLGEEHEMRNDANEVGKLTDILSNSFLINVNNINEKIEFFYDGQT